MHRALVSAEDGSEAMVLPALTEEFVFICSASYRELCIRLVFLRRSGIQKRHGC
jgi:hypothetical protein